MIASPVHFQLSLFQWHGWLLTFPDQIFDELTAIICERTASRFVGAHHGSEAVKVSWDEDVGAFSIGSEILAEVEVVGRPI